MLTSLRNVAFYWLISSFTLLDMLALSATQLTLKDENVNKCIRMGITLLKIFIWGGKLLFLW